MGSGQFTPVGTQKVFETRGSQGDALATTSEAGPYSDSSLLSSKALYMKKAHLPSVRIFKNIHNNVYDALEATRKEGFWKYLEHLATSVETSKNSSYPKVTAFVYCKTDILL